MRRAVFAIFLFGLATSVSGCVAACRPAHVGYYGRVHGGGCAVY